MELRKKPIIFAIALFSALSLYACSGGGDTDGGPGNGDAGIGDIQVSDGGSGSTMRIVLEDGTNELTVGVEENFQVIATDPSGNGLSFIRIFCETEQGIAILEPSSGGVAFESTNATGIMSGVLGGLTPGSYLIECRAPQGFNLVARRTLRVTGEIPEGFAGFPGAAGGNLGGGLFTDPLTEQVVLTNIRFTSPGNTTPTREGFIDTFFTTDCNGDGIQGDPEPYGPDVYTITVENNFDQRISIQSVQFDIGPSMFSSLTELAGLVVPANTEVDLTGVFTELDSASANEKYLAGTISSRQPLQNGTFNVVFTVSGETVAGVPFSETQTATIVIGRFNNC